MKKTRRAKTDLKSEFVGIRLKNPVLAASGTFGYGSEMSRFCPIAGLGGIIVKSLTLRPRAGNPPPRVAETASGMLNCIGLQNVGVDAFLRDKLPALRRWRIPIIVNVAGGSVDEYEEVCRRMEGAGGVAAIELNISCPNVKSGGIEFGRDPRQTERVTSRARKALRVPLIVKLSPNVTDIAVIARAALSGGADALSLVNTFLGMTFDSRTLRPLFPNVFGGLSGPAIKPLALRCVWEAAGAVRLPILGGGGIACGQDAAEFLAAGAQAVSVGTASLIDPGAAVRVAGELREVMAAHGIRRVQELTGRARRGCEGER